MIRLAVRCLPEQAEVVLAELVAAYPDGVEESAGPGYVEYALYGAPGELPELPALEAMVGDGLVEVGTEEIPDDWADRWRDFHRPRKIAGRLYLRPPWEAAQDGLTDVVIDPGRAFGTGSHPTTAMCLEFLCRLADEGHATGALADWGTGSGVLAVAAAKLGWDPVLACDNEAAALEHAGANAAANQQRLELLRLDVRTEAPPPAQTACANLTTGLLEICASRLGPGIERLVCSGFTPADEHRIMTAFSSAGLSPLDSAAEGDWAALLLTRST